MNKKQIISTLKEIQGTVARVTCQSTGLLRPSDKGDLDRVYLLGYVDGRLKQLIKSIEADIPQILKEEGFKNET